MSEQIIAALAKLDPANDAQWTKDGLPKLDIMSELTGDPKLTRKAVTNASPTFTRENTVVLHPTLPTGDAMPVLPTGDATVLPVGDDSRW